MADLKITVGLNKTLSYTEVTKDLKDIGNRLNNAKSKALKVAAQLDVAGTKKILKADLTTLATKPLSVKLKFGVDTKYIEKQLKEFYKNYKPNDGPFNNKKSTSASENKQLLSRAVAEARQISQLQSELANTTGSALKKTLTEQIASHQASLAALKESVNSIADQTERQRLLNTLAEKEAEFRERIARATAKGADRTTNEKDFAKVYKDAAAYMEQYGTLLAKNSPELYRQLLDLVRMLGSGTFAGGASDAGKALDDLKGKAAETGATVEKLGQKMTRIFNDKYIYGVMAALALSARRVFSTLFQNVVEVDAAMTELKKVTQETDATYDSFLKTASARTKELGATLSDVVTATADFARLGYNLADASTLADTAIVYKNVGDGISDISAASESIISTMQAFGIEATNAMSIVDKFNNVGKFCLAA